MNIKVLTDISRYLLSIWFLLLVVACTKTGYLDEDAASREPLAAKISFINALPAQDKVNFWTYATQVTPSPVAFGSATSYLNTQFGDVQINVSPGQSTTYLSSRQFGNSETFTATGGPNGPIPSYYHTVIAAPSLASSSDTLILFYDDLAVPPAGKAKIRFVNFAIGEAVDLENIKSGSTIFSGVSYGSAGASLLSGSGLTAFSLGPFILVDAESADYAVKRSNGQTPVSLSDNPLSGLSLESGRIYTIILTRLPGEGTGIGALVFPHN